MDFWQRLDSLLAGHTIVLDRPKGSHHPRYPEIVYPLDYGYLKDTSAADGNGIDIWRGSLSGNHLVGVVCTVDSFKQDAEIKLLIDCTSQERDIINGFYNGSHSMSGLLVKR